MLMNKKVLVVGAGGLLGAQLVNELLNNNSKVVAVDLNVEVMRERLCLAGVNVNDASLVLSEANITDECGLQKLFSMHSDLDGAVNCSYPRNKNYGRHFFDVAIEDFNENVTLNLGSAFLLMQQCAKYFNNQKRNFSLVNISSIYGVVAPKFEIYQNTKMTMPVEYAAIKSGLIHLSKYVTKYVSDSRFRVNLVSPGGILDAQPQSFLDEYKRLTLGTGMLQPKDILGAIVFLLSDQSKYMNGQNLIVDDGFSL